MSRRCRTLSRARCRTPRERRRPCRPRRWARSQAGWTWAAWAWEGRARSRADVFEGPVQDLIDELGHLPGVGPKSAQRIAFHLLAADPADITRLQDVLQTVKQGVKFCEVCSNVA